MCQMSLLGVIYKGLIVILPFLINDWKDLTKRFTDKNIFPLDDKDQLLLYNSQL